MRRKIIAANWKMHKNLDESLALVSEVRGMLRDEFYGNTEVVIIPPFTSLSSVKRLLEGTELMMGAQNCHYEENGAFTGEISANMVKSTGCAYVLVGHSERRQFFNETNDILAKKVKSAIRQELKVIYCCGETLQEREDSSYMKVIEAQISEGLFHLDRKEFSNVVVAYEPVWAIGTGKTATPEMANDMHMFIRKVIANFYSEEIAQNTSILYGGSVKPDNATSLFKCSDIDGGLIGGASLKARDFIEIVKSTHN